MRVADQATQRDGWFVKKLADGRCSVIEVYAEAESGMALWVKVDE